MQILLPVVGDSYLALTTHISTCVEEQLYRFVAREMQDDHLPKNRSELVMSNVRTGMMSLLEKRPDMKGKLHVLFNQCLPAPLRKLTWRLHLSNTKARMEYLSHVSMNKATSVLDRDISLQCLSVLSSERTFQHLKDNKLAFRAMRNVLSYYHKHRSLPAGLCRTDYFLLVPLLQAVIDTSTPSTSVDSVSTLLVEEYITFMELRPSYMRLASTEDSTGRNMYEEVASLLHQINRDLANTIQGIYTQQANKAPDSVPTGVQCMMQPVVQALFAGFLSMSTLLYVWDQYIIGLDQPAYNCLPAISAAFILLLQDHLVACQTTEDVEEVIRTQGLTLSIQQFQNVISRHFFTKFYSILCKDEHEPHPIHDPSQAIPPWSHLSRAPLLPRTRPQDRRQAREEREMLQRQRIEKQKQEQSVRRHLEEEQRRQEESRLQRLLEETKRTFTAQRDQLLEQLSWEQQFHYETQKAADEQIKGLQAEIGRLLEQRRLSMDTNSAGSLVVPPPSLHSQTPPQTGKPSPSSPVPVVLGGTLRTREVSGKTAESVTLDLLREIMQSADSMVNGKSDAERDSLNTMTRDHLHTYRRDVRNAEIETFGHEITSREIQNIPEPTKTELNKRLSVAIRRGTEARYKAQFTSGRLLEVVTYAGTP
ncbi:uncharacterized protein LOC115482553 isoform X2 [Microcaecilia unicolor]|uniref:Uncharacterized protein LOC115482553 isoform X2 n=1 Tax=Microcaecilia unicolor TaxID=1415580 RepID=A0A6P7ZZX9_9AMPH|nr:uncharacterized protein LOC115482553 isoform X2 [Microcaecilia unicolor]